jgi:hypothetical protein
MDRVSVSDVTRLWNDLVVLENNTDIRILAKYHSLRREPFLWYTKPPSGNGRDAKPFDRNPHNRFFNPQKSNPYTCFRAHLRKQTPVLTLNPEFSRNLFQIGDIKS